jgi:hypothetical protein
MNNIQINKIDNGYLIMTPPAANTLKLGSPINNFPPPTVHYVADMDELIAYLQGLDL